MLSSVFSLEPLMADYNENKFEREIAECLAANGWFYARNDDGTEGNRNGSTGRL